MYRPLTFPKIGKHWVNHETGVRIIRRSGAHGSRPEYRVLAPVLSRTTPVYESMPRRTLAQAKALAADFANTMRMSIAQAYHKAQREDAERRESLTTP